MLIGQPAANVTPEFNEIKIKLHMFIYGGLSEGILRFRVMYKPPELTVTAAYFTVRRRS